MSEQLMSDHDVKGRELKHRTKQFAVRVVRMCEALPRSYAAKVFACQLIRSASSVGANYRAACRSRTRKEFISKMRVVVEEADESQYWLELIEECELLPAKKLVALNKESAELTAIFTSSLTTARKQGKKS